MSEFNQGLDSISKAINNRQEMIEKRPGLIVEVGSSRLGALVFEPVRKEFTEDGGQFEKHYYIGIDSELEEPTTVLKSYASFAQARASQSSELESHLEGKVDEVWIGNPGSIKEKDWFKPIYRWLVPGGQAIIFDTSSEGNYYRDEKETIDSLLADLGFHVEDLSEDYQALSWRKAKMANHPLIEASMKRVTNFAAPAVIILTKPE